MSSGGEPASGRRGGPPVRLLEADPGLAGALTPADRAAASPLLVAETWTVAEPGTWVPPSAESAQNLLCLLVLEGLALRRIASGAHQGIDVLGHRDVLRPWDESAFTSLPLEGSWQIVEPLTVAEIDLGHGPALGGHPELIAALLQRAIRRSRWLALQQHVAAIASVEERLLMVFWHLGERWGGAEPDGIALRLPLSHEQVGGMVGARRAAVANGLARLERRELIRRRSDGVWILHPSIVQRALADGEAAGCSPSSR